MVNVFGEQHNFSKASTVISIHFNKEMKVMRVVIDRIEGLYAICEMDNRKMIDVELKNIPKQAKEGDVLDIEGSFIIINNCFQF